MKKTIVLVLNLILVLSGCSFSTDTDNPISGKSTEERIVMSLEKTYPEHTFTIIKEYSDGYAVCADENGLEFRVDTMIYDNTYHFGCHDEYLKEVLFQQNYLETAVLIAKENGYKIKYSEENEYIALEVDIVNHDVNLNHVAKSLLEIVNSLEDIPEIVYCDYGFSTREVNYYTIPKMSSLLCSFISSKESGVYTGIGVKLSKDNYTVEMIEEMLEDELETAYAQEVYCSEEQEEEAAEKTEKKGIKKTESYLCEKDFGTYMIPKDWEESVYGDCYTYTDRRHNNFTISRGENNYFKEEHELFQNDIFQQMMEEYKNIEGIMLNAAGSYTEKGYPLYIFNVTADNGDKTIYYYVVGDRKHCVIQKNNYDSSSECDDAVQKVIDSFRWTE